MSPVIIEVIDLTKTFNREVKAVRKISFRVETGEIFGFLGPNGAGKSTTIMMLTTLLSPTSGRARVAGFDVVENPDKVRLSLGYISQDLAVDDNLTGRQNLFLQAGFYHLPRKEAARTIDELLDLVDLMQRADDPVETYSGGMRKRLDIATGLIHHPRVLFLDEPTLGLDIQTRHQIWRHIKRLREEMGMTIFLTTHYMDEAENLCDRIGIIDKGVIRVIDSPDRLKARIGENIVRIKFADNQAKEVAEALELIGGLDVVDKITLHDSICSVVVKEGDAAMPEIFQAAYPSRARISSITLKKPSLDDVYLAFTGRELRNETGSRDEARRSHMILRRMRS